MLVYFSLQISLIVVCTIGGYYLSKNKSSKICFWIIVITFTLIEGLRFGRGIDYNIYAQEWVAIAGFGSKIDKNPIFTLYAMLLYHLDFSYQIFVMSFSFLLIYSGLKFLLRYKEVMMFSLPIFVFLCYSAENLFKWYGAFSFFLLAYCAFKENKYAKSIMFVLLSIGTHAMFMPMILFIIVLYRIDKIILSVWLAFLLFCGLYIIWQNEYMVNLLFIIESFSSFFESYSGYADNAEVWLTGSNRREVVINITTVIKMLMIYMPALYYGRLVIRRKKELLPFYNLLILGFVLYPMMHRIELADRFNQVMIIYICIFLAYSFYGIYVKSIFHISRLTVLFITLSFSVQLYAMFRLYIPENKWYTMFVWDAKGREYIDTLKLFKY